MEDATGLKPSGPDLHSGESAGTDRDTGVREQPPADPATATLDPPCATLLPTDNRRRTPVQPFDPAQLTPKERVRRTRRAARTDAVLAVRALSQPALIDYADSLWWGYHDPDWDRADRELFQLHRGQRLKVVQDELERRRRIEEEHALPPSIRIQSDRLTTLARAIGAQVHLADVLEGIGQQVARGRNEAHTECPQCGGRDRFVIWPPPRSRGWCRQCGWTPDVIEFWRWFDGSSFADAVLAVAERYLGMGRGDSK